MAAEQGFEPPTKGSKGHVPDSEAWVALVTAARQLLSAAPVTSPVVASFGATKGLYQSDPNSFRCCWNAAQNALAALLAAANGPQSDFALVCRKRSQYFRLLPLGNLDEVESTPKFSCDFIELLGRDPEFAVGLFQS